MLEDIFFRKGKFFFHNKYMKQIAGKKIKISDILVSEHTHVL